MTRRPGAHRQQPAVVLHGLSCRLHHRYIPRPAIGILFPIRSRQQDAAVAVAGSCWAHWVDTMRVGGCREWWLAYVHGWPTRVAGWQASWQKGGGVAPGPHSKQQHHYQMTCTSKGGPALWHAHTRGARGCGDVRQLVGVWVTCVMPPVWCRVFACLPS